MTAVLLVGEWADNAACKDKPTRWWFSDTEDTSYYDGARRICERCPVQAECLDHAIRNHEVHGMWGGMTPAQRRQVRRRRVASGEQFPLRPRIFNPGPSKPAECGTVSGYKKHRRDHTEICDACREANTESSRSYRAIA